jgi:hypothetical protein
MEKTEKRSANHAKPKFVNGKHLDPLTEFEKTVIDHSDESDDSLIEFYWETAVCHDETGDTAYAFYEMAARQIVSRVRATTRDAASEPARQAATAEAKKKRLAKAPTKRKRNAKRLVSMLNGMVTAAGKAVMEDGRMLKELTLDELKHRGGVYTTLHKQISTGHRGTTKVGSVAPDTLIREVFLEYGRKQGLPID